MPGNRWGRPPVREPTGARWATRCDTRPIRTTDRVVRGRPVSGDYNLELSIDGGAAQTLGVCTSSGFGVDAASVE